MKLAFLSLLTLTLAGCVLVPAYSPSPKAGSGTVLLCHKGKKTMELPREAAQAHFNHGDSRGPC